MNLLSYSKIQPGLRALSRQTKINILNEEDRVLESLDLTERDAIFNSDYRQMITDAF